MNHVHNFQYEKIPPQITHLILQLRGYATILKLYVQLPPWEFQPCISFFLQTFLCTGNYKLKFGLHC